MYNLGHVLTLTRKHLRIEDKDIKIEDISFYHFRDNPVNHNNSISNKSFREIFENSHYVFFVDSDERVKILKSRYSFFKIGDILNTSQ